MATLITGASSGIGEEFARRYAAQKKDLVLVARSQDKLNKLAKEFTSQHGIRVTVFALDLSEPDAAERLWEETNRAELEIDVLVNNAGFGTSGDVADERPERLEQEVRLNCLTLTG
ncbi:MAG: SDR family NAD(P)-dependent oxidoreductase, partial [Rothia dentocariosa]